MAIDRRHFIGAAATTGAFGATEAVAAPAPAASTTVPVSGLGVEAIHLGVRFNGTEDQTEALQRAIDRTAGARLPLILAPGVYRARGLVLPTGARLVGVPGATRIVATDNAPIIVARGADYILLSGITFDGSGKALPEKSGLIQLANGRGVAIRDCEVIGAGRNGIVLEGIEGEITGTTITGALGAAIHALDSRGLVIARNTIRNAANNGIQVWRSAPGDDGTQVLDNRIEDTAAQSGGSGQNGNAINVYRAHNVTVRGNRIRNAAFSAVRGNAASNIQITNNTCTGLRRSRDLCGVRLRGRGDRQQHDRRRRHRRRGDQLQSRRPARGGAGQPDPQSHPEAPRRHRSERRQGIGIGVEADTAVTGNIIENAPVAGISVGWGQYLRDVSVTGNVVRSAGVGIAVSVTPGAGSAVIADNLISGTKDGAIVGMDQRRAMTGDLAREGAARYAQLAINGNRVR